MRRRRPALAAGFAVVLFVVGQLVAWRHEAESRHVTCIEHGEQLEAAGEAGEADNCGQPHWIGIDGNGGGEHQECASARLLRTSTNAPDVAPVHAVTSVIIATLEPPPSVVWVRTAHILLIAPKTSPPA